ncbi:MAG: hypothetical protein ACKOW9_03220 [Candidatus Paceibacterota bacterium]
MAQKIIIELEVDAKGSAPTLQALKDNLKALKKEIAGVEIGSDAFKILQQKIVQSNAELKALNKSFTTFETEAEASANSIKGMEENLKALKTEILTVEVGSQEFKKLQSEIIAADSKLKNLKKSVEGIGSEQLAGEIGKLAGGISASFTAVSAIVGKGNKEFEEFTQNIIAGIAVTQGIKGATEAWGAAQRLLNLALASNPFGLVVAGVAALAGGITALISVMNDFTEEAEQAAKQQERYNQALIDGKLAILPLEAELATLNGEYEKANELQKELFDTKKVDSINKLIKEFRDNYDNLPDAIQESIDKENEYRETIAQKYSELEDLEAKKGTTITIAQRQQLQADIAEKERQIDLVETMLSSRISMTEKLFTTDKEYNRKRQNIEDEYNASIALAEKKALEEKKRNVEEILQLEFSLRDEIFKVQTNINNIKLSSYKLEQAQKTGLYEFEKDLLVKQFANEERIRKEENRKLIEAKQKEIDEIKILDDAAQEAKNKAVAELSTLQKKQAEENITIKQNEAEQIKALDKKINEEAEKKTADSLQRSKLLNIELLANEEDLAIQKNEIAKKTALENINVQLETLNAGGKQLTEHELALQQALNDEKLVLDKFYENEKLKIVKDFAKRRDDLLLQLQTEDENRDVASLQRRLEIYSDNAFKRLDIEKELVDKKLQIELEGLQKTADTALENIEKQKTAGIISEEEAAKEKVKITEDLERDKAEIEDLAREEKKKKDLQAAEDIKTTALSIEKDLAQAALNINIQSINDRTHFELEALTNKQKALDDSLKNGLISQEIYNAELDKINLEKKAADLKNRQDVAKAQKEASLIQVAIETAKNVVEAYPNPLGIGLAIATGAAQAAVIQSQPIPTYAKGGILKGKKHSNGGIPIYSTGGQIAEAEGGEPILTANVSNNPALTAIASLVNEAAGGTSFSNVKLSSYNASTPVQPAIIDNAALQAIVKQTVKGVISIPVNNVATDTDKVARKVKNIEQRSTF